MEAEVLRPVKLPAQTRLSVVQPSAEARGQNPIEDINVEAVQTDSAVAEITAQQAMAIARERILNPDLPNTLTAPMIHMLLLGQFKDLSAADLETTDFREEGARVKQGDLLDSYYNTRRELYRAEQKAKVISARKAREKAIDPQVQRLAKWRKNIGITYPGLDTLASRQYRSFIDSIFDDSQ